MSHVLLEIIASAPKEFGGCVRVGPRTQLALRNGIKSERGDPMNAIASVRDEYVEHACDVLEQTMAPEHKALVENELRAHAAWELTPRPELEPKMGNLTNVFLH